MVNRRRWRKPRELFWIHIDQSRFNLIPLARVAEESELGDTLDRRITLILEHRAKRRRLMVRQRRETTRSSENVRTAVHAVLHCCGKKTNGIKPREAGDVGWTHDDRDRLTRSLNQDDHLDLTTFVRT